LFMASAFGGYGEPAQLMKARWLNLVACPVGPPPPQLSSPAQLVRCVYEPR
jgi:hypothetical protein